MFGDCSLHPEGAAPETKESGIEDPNPRDSSVGSGGMRQAISRYQYIVLWALKV